MTLSDQLDELEDELGLNPLGVACDGGCGAKLTRHDERYSKYVPPMQMLLCPKCADDAGWIDDDD